MLRTKKNYLLLNTFVLCSFLFVYCKYLVKNMSMCKKSKYEICKTSDFVKPFISPETF